MSNDVLGVILVAVCLLYAASFLIGWRLAKSGRLDLTRLMTSRRALVDPLTRRFQQWCQRKKMDALREQRWLRLGLLISANNLGAVALVGRTLYGVALAPAAYFTYRQGLSHAAVFARAPTRPPGALLSVAVLEFGSYLLATALGVNLVATPLAGGAFRDAVRSLVIFYPVVAMALLLGAWLEVHALRSRMPAGLQLPPDLEMDDIRAKALEMIAGKK